jgi:hypothetical protein
VIDTRHSSLGLNHSKLKQPLYDIIEEAKSNFAKNPQPRKLGNLYCFWYNSQNKPRIVIGPDWKYALAELIMVNTVSLLILYFIDKGEHLIMCIVGLLLLLIQNISFILTVTVNPGIVSRDISIHK